MTGLGHASVSYLIARSTPKSVIAACVLGGIIPDIDFVFILFPFFNSIHRVVTHNVFFVLIAAGIISAFFKEHHKTAFLCALGCGMVHLLIDSMLDQNPTNGLGVALFYPLSNWMFCPINLVAVDPHSEGWNNLSRSLQKIGVIVLYEIPFYIFACWLWIKNRNRLSDNGIKKIN